MINYHRKPAACAAALAGPRSADVTPDVSACLPVSC